MKHELDFEIYTNNNPKNLIFIDCSDYFEKPSNLIYEIKFPDLEKRYTALGNSITSVNTKLIGYSGNIIEMPDGMYTIRMSVAPNKTVFTCKNYLKLDKLNCRIAKLLQEECLDLDQLNWLQDVDRYLTVAKAIVETDPDLSIKYFKEAKTLINKKENCNE